MIWKVHKPKKATIAGFWFTIICPYGRPECKRFRVIFHSKPNFGFLLVLGFPHYLEWEHLDWIVRILSDSLIITTIAFTSLWTVTICPAQHEVASISALRKIPFSYSCRRLQLHWIISYDQYIVLNHFLGMLKMFRFVFVLNPPSEKSIGNAIFTRLTIILLHRYRIYIYIFMSKSHYHKLQSLFL
jgi:hypothetical protein